MLRNFYILLVAGFTVSCATPKPPSSVESLRSVPPLPADAFITQRGTLTVRGQQFTLNGYVAKSSTQGLRFILTENFGGVLADVLIKPNGQTLVLKSKPPFRPTWVEHYIAADLKCIFSDRLETNCPVQILSPTHFLIERRWYQLDLRTIEVKPGPQAAEMFVESPKGQL